jgi:threonylcarbamoyladenosine tRNA methylthiotransferase CDKAL1
MVLVLTAVPDLLGDHFKVIPSAMIKREAEQAVAEGCREIQLTAQDSAAYGKDTGESLSSDLMNKIADIDGEFRIRVGMMHPKSMMGDVEGIINAF